MVDLLREDLVELAPSVTAHADQIDRLTTAKGSVEAALARSEEERRTAAELHSNERVALNETVAMLRDDASQLIESRLSAEPHCVAHCPRTTAWPPSGA